MRFTTLDEWLSWQEGLNPAEIDLGLERVSRVLQQAGYADAFACPLITVAGTNGKGSVVACIEAIALAQGCRTGTYTSPHLLKYNERIRINGVDVDDLSLCQAFERIDRAREGIDLTYFEFGTLAAIDLFREADLDLVIMEVGLGGRLDAVNIMQPDVAVITTIAIDHTEWLGSDREAIGFEKAGILRSERAAVCGDADPPRSLLERAEKLGADLKLIGRHFRADRRGERWDFGFEGDGFEGLPLPALNGEFQLSNAATAIMALKSIKGFQLSGEALRLGLEKVRLPGRFQKIMERPEVIVDVAHNPQAAAALKAQLSTHACGGDTHAVVAMLADKPVAEATGILSDQVDRWYTAGLASVARGLEAGDMAAAVERTASDVKLSAASTVATACEQALAAAEKNDRIIIFGSFYTVAEAMRYFASRAR